MNRWQRLLYQPGIPLGDDGRRVTASYKHRMLSKNAAKEGIVLLKNNGGLLPLSGDSRIALFGKAVFDYVKGGGGSGDVTVDHSVNIYEGICSLGYGVLIEDKLADYYRDYVKGEYEKGLLPGLIAEPLLPDALCENARAFTDTAVIVISRFSGEGWDRSVSGQDERLLEREAAKQSAELFRRGDFYLSDSEAEMVRKVTALFPKVAVVLNVGGMIDTEWFYQNDSIGAVLMAWQGGIEGGTAAAELLFGIGNPSGKLSDTFAKSLPDYPSTADFHESADYVEYTEDIYVGYRYFETVPHAAERVNYPFGYGLSYTTFSYEYVSGKYLEDGRKISIAVNVKNTGKVPGKEVVQIYASCPGGILGKPAKVLAAFCKTNLLKPGEDEMLELSFETDSLASYDDTGKIQAFAYVMEKGKYAFYAGTSVRDVKLIPFMHEETEDRVVMQLSEKLSPKKLKRRMLSDGTYEALPVDRNAERSPYGEEIRNAPAYRYIPPIYRRTVNPPDFIDVASGKMSLDDFVSGLTDEELCHLLGGQPNTGLANTYGFGNMPDHGVPNAMTADGPAGLRIRPECGVVTTAFPCATLLACTWNPEVTFRVGECGASEVKENNIAAWLTPAVNIHRSPLCGRNFEYYSEDPLLTGVMAASMVKGIQSQGIAATVKHFAANNKETRRKESDSRVSERALREIYLKAFEIIVKTAGPWCVMTSYNIINGVRASENRDLITGILREEWGFDGMVCTDWWNHGRHLQEVKAGSDVKMACGYPEQLLTALKEGVLTREEIEACAKRVLVLLLRFE